MYVAKSVLLVGVGGQGTILAGKILSQALLGAGYDVKMSEIHGMSQRGGSVSTHVRYGEKIESPVIERGGADILVGFELMEALRWLEYLNPSGDLIVNNYQINPMPVLIGKAEYPGNLLEKLTQSAKTVSLNAFDEAKALGDSRAMNVVLLGAAAKKFGLASLDWETVISQEVRKEFFDINVKAFNRGQVLVA